MRSRLLLLSLSLSVFSAFASAQSVEAPNRPAATAPAANAVQPPAVKAAAPAPETAPAPASKVAAPAGPDIKIKDVDAPAQGVAVKGAKDASGHDTISVDFPDDDIRNILRNVADLFELNLVIPDALQGKSSVKLRDVSWRQIFQVILAPVNYTYMEEGNIIKIVSNESLQQEPVTTEVFILNYARSADIQATIASLVDPASGGKLVVDARSNALVITERPTRLTRIRPIIESLDRATDQVMIESKFVEVTDRDVRNLGVNWSSLSGLQVGAGQLKSDFSRTRSNDVANTTSNGQQNTAQTNQNTNLTTTNQNTVTNTNIAGNTSAVNSNNGALTSTSSSTSEGTLNNTSVADQNNQATNLATNLADTTFNSLRDITYGAATGRTATAVFSASDFNLVLSALNTLNNTKIVSNPTVVTLNNNEATINVGEEFPIPNYTYNQERGTFEVSGFQYKQIGIILKVKPQVNSRGFINLMLEPEVSQRNGETTFGGAGGASIPIIATRKAKTQVSLKDGFTMGIGGLLRRQTTDGGTKVPLLGDIPIIGNAFRSKSKNEETTNLIIFITAKVLSGEGAPLQQIFDPRQVRGLNLRENDLPGYREPSNALIPNNAPTAEEQEKKKSFFRFLKPGSSESKDATPTKSAPESK